MVTFPLVLLAAALVDAAPTLSLKKDTDIDLIGTQTQLFPFLAGSAPHYSYPLSYGIPKEVPEQCTLKQIQLFARHGERYPTNGTGAKIVATYNKMANLTSLNGSLAFLNNGYEFFIPNSDNYEELTTWENTLDPINPYLGEQDARLHAREFLNQYSELLENTTSFAMFTSNSKRVHDTAKFFADA